jgi:hypothetical protein
MNKKDSENAQLIELDNMIFEYVKDGELHYHYDRAIFYPEEDE